MLAGAPPFEAELLRRGERGMRQLVAAGAPPAGYVSRAARRVLEQPRGRCLLLSGFYVRKARAAETDGPPGAATLGKALTAVGFDVTYVADDATAGVLQAVVGSSADVLRFPMGTSAASDTAFAERLLADVRPTLCASVERCGRNGDGKYLSCRGEDLGDVTARADAIFDAVHRQRELVATASEAYEQYRGCLLLAVGDGGNECGMGNVADAVRALRSSAAASDQELQRLPEKPCEVASDECLVGDTSNWTAYALAAAIEVGARAAGRTVPSLLPTAEQSAAMLQAVVDAGGVDGVTCEASATVDGFEPHVDAEVLARLARVRDEALERQAAH